MNTATQQNTARLEMINPATLIVDTNVRKDHGLTPEFLDSLTQHGVIQPVRAYQAEDGIHVIAGQRRTLGAIQAGLETIPVYVTDPITEDAQTVAVQIIENAHRAELTDKDTAEGIEQMAAFGMDAGEIAKALATTKKAVNHSLEVSGTKTGAKALGAGLTLDQAATLAEFEDYPDILAELEQIAEEKPEALDHCARNARSKIERDRQCAEALAWVQEKGLTLLDQSPGYGSGKIKALEDLRTAEGQPVPESEATAAYVESWSGRLVLAMTGWKAKGYVDRYGGTTAGGPMTEEEKAERRKVIENNRLMRDANEVRREWVSALLARTKAPTRAGAFTAAMLASRSWAMSPETAADLMGKDLMAWKDWAVKTPSKAAQVSLALAISTVEARMDKGAWRQSTSELTAMSTYLTQLQEWGYTPAQIEQTIMGHASPTKTDDEAQTSEDTDA